MKIIFHPYDLKLRHTFKITHGAHDMQRTLVVELKEGNKSGYGEATANPYYGVTVEKMIAALEKVKDKIESHPLDNPEQFWEDMHPFLNDIPFAQCALDIAAHDLYGKKLEKPLYEVWGLDIDSLPVSNYTIGIDSIDKMVQKMTEYPWPLYKIKLGTHEDVEIIRELRKHSDAIFRVDANCAWEVEEAIENSRAFKTLNVEFIEQPLRADNMKGMEKLYAESVLPLIADESCQVESDVEKCYGKFHGVNIKLTKCGGLTPARRMIAKARELNMKVMVGCMTESSVGISAIGHLLPLLDYVDMDGALLLAEDVASGVRQKEGRVIFPAENGTGASLLVK